MARIEHDIEELLAPAIEALALELWGVEYRPGRGDALLRLYIDVAERPVTLDDCEKVSREVSALLDVHDPIDSQYTLEVSSPGLERPLFKPEHYARFIGDRAKIELEFPVAGRRRFQGAILAASPDTVTIEQDGQPVELAIEQIQRARLVVAFDPPAKPGGAARRGAKNGGRGS